MTRIKLAQSQTKSFQLTMTKVVTNIVILLVLFCICFANVPTDAQCEAKASVIGYWRGENLNDETTRNRLSKSGSTEYSDNGKFGKAFRIRSGSKYFLSFRLTV